MYHRSCETLPYSHFIEIILNGNLSWLIISGHPSPQDLLYAWEEILEEYTSLVKTDKSENTFGVYKKIKVAESNMLIIEWCLGTLKLKYDPEIAQILNDLGFGVVEYSDDRDEYLRSLYAIETSAKTLIILLNQYKAEYKLLNPESTDSIGDLSRIRYEKEIAILSRFQGYRIIKEKITVLEYCAIINAYLDYVKAHKKENPNGR